MHDYYVLIDGLLHQYYDDDVREEFMTDPDRGWGGYTVAVHDAFNELVSTITRPDATFYLATTRPDGSSAWTVSDLSLNFVLPIGHGRYFSTAWWDENPDFLDETERESFPDCGIYFWDCFHHHGYYLNKLLALMALSEAETFFVARDTAEDVRQWRISYFDDHAPQILDLMGGILSEDYASFAPWAEQDQSWENPPIYFDRDYAAPEMDIVNSGEISARALPLEPATGFSVQLYAAVLGFGRFHHNFDSRFINSARLWIQGNGHGSGTEETTVSYEDPETGIVYQANALANDRGVAQRMIAHANAIRARSSSCTEDEDAPDACVPRVPEDEQVAADRELALYRDQLDIMVHLTAAYDNWYLSYGDPFNPGSVPEDW